MDIFSEELI